MAFYEYSVPNNPKSPNTFIYMAMIISTTYILEKLKKR